MRLLQQMMEKKINLSNEFMLKKSYLRGISHFYGAYNLAVSLVDFNEDFKITKIRQKVWKRFFLSSSNKKILSKLMDFMRKDRKVINMAFNQIEEQDKDKEEGLGDLDRPLAIGVVSYDFPE